MSSSDRDPDKGKKRGSDKYPLDPEFLGRLQAEEEHARTMGFDATADAIRLLIDDILQSSEDPPKP